MLVNKELLVAIHFYGESVNEYMELNSMDYIVWNNTLETNGYQQQPTFFIVIHWTSSILCSDSILSTCFLFICYIKMCPQ